MRERPILMNGDMVRAILAGTKTQTRRPVKLKVGHDNRFDIPGKRTVMNIRDPRAVEFCPFGQPGSRLWVREPGSISGIQRLDAGAWNVQITYSTDKAYNIRRFPERLLRGSRLPQWADRFQGIPNGIFREAARLFLEIVSVRVERVQEISEQDATAEGAKWDARMYPMSFYFKELWDSVYAAKGQGWDANPWVWVVEFKRTEASA